MAEILKIVNEFSNFSINDLKNSRKVIGVKTEEEFDKMICILDKEPDIYISNMMKKIYKKFGKEYPELCLSIHKDDSPGIGFLYRVRWCPIDDYSKKHYIIIPSAYIEKNYKKN